MADKIINIGTGQIIGSLLPQPNTSKTEEAKNIMDQKKNVQPKSKWSQIKDSWDYMWGQGSFAELEEIKADPLMYQKGYEQQARSDSNVYGYLTSNGGLYNIAPLEENSIPVNRYGFPVQAINLLTTEQLETMSRNLRSGMGHLLGYLQRHGISKAQIEHKAQFPKEVIDNQQSDSNILKPVEIDPQAQEQIKIEEKLPEEIKQNPNVDIQSMQPIENEEIQITNTPKQTAQQIVAQKQQVIKNRQQEQVAKNQQIEKIQPRQENPTQISQQQAQSDPISIQPSIQEESKQNADDLANQAVKYIREQRQRMQAEGLLQRTPQNGFTWIQRIFMEAEVRNEGNRDGDIRDRQIQEANEIADEIVNELDRQDWEDDERQDQEVNVNLFLQFLSTVSPALASLLTVSIISKLGAKGFKYVPSKDGYDVIPHSEEEQKMIDDLKQHEQNDLMDGCRRYYYWDYSNPNNPKLRESIICKTGKMKISSDHINSVNKQLFGGSMNFQPSTIIRRQVKRLPRMNYNQYRVNNYRIL